MTYKHRMMRPVGRAMRVKLDRSFRLGGRRYRPGELVDVEVPREFLDCIEEVK